MKQKRIEIDVPEQHIGKEMKIVYRPVNENIKSISQSKKTIRDFWNVLSDEGATKLREHAARDREEWERNI